jgi:2-polyprenyl-6-methoxyphenol hydroxylase-like FAD-dependent oxidoreductase
MGNHVVIIGGSIGGLGAALGLARRGARCTIVERDPGPDTDDGDEAFDTWERRNVAQFRQPHGFSARARNLLLEHAPDVLDRLAADGIVTSNFFKELAPRELWTADDDAFDGVMSRRPAFELALRRTAEAEPGITFRSPAQVTGLVVAHGHPQHDGARPVVTGVRLDGGGTLDADVVLDAGGRRTLVPGWLAAAGAELPYESQDCELTYHTRYYRLRPDSPLPMFAVVTVNSEIPGGAMLLGFPGDHGAIGICLATTPGDDELSAIRTNEGFTAALTAFPSVQGWVDPANSTPINDVAVMAGNRNLRRRFVADGRPLALGVLPVGDALCTTNPQYGWGASMALTYAFAAVDAITDHAGDLEAMALAYDAAVGPEADAVYRESAASDRYRLYRWRGQEALEPHRAARPAVRRPGRARAGRRHAPEVARGRRTAPGADPGRPPRRPVDRDHGNGIGHGRPLGHSCGHRSRSAAASGSTLATAATIAADRFR